MKFKVFPASAAYDSIKQSNADQRAHEYNDRQEGGVRNGILDLYVSDGFTDTDMYVWLCLLNPVLLLLQSSRPLRGGRYDRFSPAES